MALRSVGINLFGGYLSEERTLAEDPGYLKEAHPDFVEVCPHSLNLMDLDNLDLQRLGELRASPGRDAGA